ncbi:unnamed protein product, partial [Effrenium voratum]
VDLLLARHANAEALSCNGSSPLALAARAGHVDCMKVLLKAAASSSSASTLAAPLQEAAKRNHPDAVELLLDHKAAVDSPPGSASALQLAVQQGHLEVARQLLRRGAATGRTGKSGAALLHSAVQLCQAETLRLLLDSNADVDQPMQDTDGDTGCTALHLAAQQGFEEGLRLLLDANARADLEMRGGFTPLALAARAGHGACCQLLCEGAGTSRVDAKTAAGWTPLLLACKAGHVAMARQLLDAGASVNLPSTRGRTPLMASLESEGGFWLAELLLKRRAALDPALPGGWTALHLACHLKSTALPLLLAAAPEEVWRETEQGWTPLHVAAQSGDVRSARALLRSRASSPALSCKQDPGIPRSRQGFCTAITPLHIAAEAGHEEMVRLLLQEGASPNAVAERRASPLHLAAGAGGSDVETAAAVAEALLEHGAEVDAVMDSGATALMVAARQGREAVARVLLRHGAELRRRLPNGWCSFLLAVRNGHAPVVRLLLKPELLKVKTPAGRTPLQCAEKYGHSEVAEVLREAERADWHLQSSNLSSLVGRLWDGDSSSVFPCHSFSPRRSSSANALRQMREWTLRMQKHSGSMPSQPAAGPSGLQATPAMEDALPAAVPQPEANPEPQARAKGVKRVVLEKQSGIRGINWQQRMFAWRLTWSERDETGASKVQVKTFGLSKYKKMGQTERVADASALAEAKAAREELIAQGRIKERNTDPEFTSPIPGVKWRRDTQRWVIEMTLSGGKRLNGGIFRTKAEAEETCLALQEKHGVVQVVKKTPLERDLPVFKPKENFRGVWWGRRDQSWRAMAGKELRFFKPLDHSEPEVDEAFGKAVAWVKKERQRLEAEKAAKAAKKAKGRARPKAQGKKELPLEEDSVEFSLLQTSLTLSQREPLQLRHAKSLLSAVVDAAPWHANGSAALNTSSPLALLSSVTSITALRTRDVIAWPGACVLGLSFVVTLIFVVVLWAVMLEASQASKALATGRSSRQGNMPARLPEAGPVPKFGGESVENSLNARIAKPPPICPSLSLLQGAAQFRIPLLFLDKLRAGTFPMQILGPSGKPLLHAWLPLCSKSKRAGQRPERQ